MSIWFRPHDHWNPGLLGDQVGKWGTFNKTSDYKSTNELGNF